MINEELQAIKERAVKATPGRWDAVPVVDSYEYVIVGDDKREVVTAEVYARDDAIFIEYARSDVPKLVAEVERLQSEREEFMKRYVWLLEYVGRDVALEIIRKKIADGDA